MTKKERYYIDTSVIGGGLDDEFKRHPIVNIERIRGYNSVNIKKGYGTVEIRSPWEIVGYE